MNKLVNTSLLIGILAIVSSCGSIEKTLKKANTSQLANELDTKDSSYIQNQGSKRAEDRLAVDWPPKNPKYVAGTMGFQLNALFKSFANNAGLTSNEDRDFIPPPISTFIGEPKLLKQAELADISGKGLFFYVYSSDDRVKGFENIGYENNLAKKINVPGYSSFNIRVDEDLDNFMITTTSRGYIDASIEGKIKPPYAAIQIAGQRERERKTALIAIYGSFESPIWKKLENDTEIVLTLWDVYRQNKDLIGNAHYLKEFNGVISRTTVTNSEYDKLAGAGTLNFAGPIGLGLKAKLDASRESKSIFNATDWNTYINVQGLSEEARKNMYSECPTLENIQKHFKEVNAIRSDKTLFIKDFPNKHKLTFFIKGIPTDYIDNEVWSVFNASNNLENVRLDVLASEDNGAKGALFVFSFDPKRSIFKPNASSVDVFFEIESSNNITLADHTVKKLTKKLEAKVNLNNEPVIDAPKLVVFEPYIIPGTPVSSEQFAKWSFKVRVVNDEKNPVRFQSGIIPTLENIMVKGPNNNQISVNSSIDIAGGSEKAYLITLTYLGEKFDYNKIDFANGETYSFEGNLIIPLREVEGATITRPLSLALKYPINLSDEGNGTLGNDK